MELKAVDFCVCVWLKQYLKSDPESDPYSDVYYPAEKGP